MGAREAVEGWEPASWPSRAFIGCPTFEIFFGGARGSLKTESALGDWIRHESLHGEGAIGLMVRRTRTQLVETFERAKQIYVPMGFKFNESEHTCRGPTGGRLRFAHLERDSDAENYQGHSYTRVYVEEIGNFPSPSPVMKLMATLRSARGVPCGFRATGNPGGPGHGWVKARYIDPNPAGWQLIQEAHVNPWTGERVVRERTFIPGRITDHNLLGPDYVANLQMSGSPELVRAWLEGDWDVVAGAYFPEFTRGRHVLDPFDIPKSWKRFTASDWGSARPFWTGWFAIAQTELKVRTVTGRQLTLLPGALVCYREWYGEDAKRPGQNLGLKLPVEEWAAGVLKRSGEEDVAYDVIDTSFFSEDGGPSQAERAGKVRLKGKRLRLRKADKQRLPGWNQVRGRLRGDLPDERGAPMLFFIGVATPDAIRTLSALQHDDVDSKFEDADTDGEDHPCFAAGTMVRTPGGDVPIESLPKDGFVYTRHGVERYTGAGMTRAEATRVKAFFSDGSVVTCTPDHRFITESGWTQAKDMTGSWLPSAPRFKSSTASATTNAGHIFNTRASAFIARRGNGIVDRYRMVSMSTTRTTIALTMALTIWHSCRRVSTAATIQPATGRFPMRPAAELPLGTALRQGGCGIPSMRSESSIGLSRWLRDIATTAQRSIKRLLPIFIEAGFAESTARRVRCVRVEPTIAGPVYCLTVDSVGEFLLANGVAVHNCDGIRYSCMSRPRKLPDPEDRFAGQPKKGTMEWLTTEAWKGQQMPGMSKRQLG